MIKTIFFIALLGCSLSFSAAAQFSNVIIFGDSLSDGGNFPESEKVWWHPQQPKTLANAVAQLYVPFSNPVNTRDNPHQWPILDNRYLPRSIPMVGSSRPRLFRSISWPQFFLKQKIISPSELLHSREIPADFSFNYAWGYATSEKYCVNPYYAVIKQCDAALIDATKKRYENNPTKKNYLKIAIPGLYEQVNLFLQDMHQHKVVVDKNTGYIFWIGGNDLIIANNALTKHANPLPALAFLFGGSAKNILKNISHLIDQLPAHARPQKVYVFNLFNPGLTPAYYHSKLAGIAKFSVHCFNFWLTVYATFFNLFSTTKIIIVPINTWFEKASLDTNFQAQNGKSCQLTNGGYENPMTVPSTNCTGFMFWNAVHLSSSMNAVIANSFSNSILNAH